MKKILGVIIVGLIIGGIFLLPNTKKEVSHLQEASLRTNWIPSASFSGEVVGLTMFDKNHNLDVSVGFGGPGINPIQMVISGEDTFGLAGAEEVLAANEKGAELIIVGVVHYHPPAGYVSLVSKNIHTPQDLEGKAVGLLPFGNASMLYELMLKKNKINREKITEITISNDMKSFLSGAYDVHPIFVYDETVDLDRSGVKYTIMRPEDFGVTAIKGYVYFTKRTTYEEKPEMVKAFVETMADGWNYALKNPDEAITMLKTFAPEIDIIREREVLERGIPYFTAYKNQPINSDTESWNEMVEELKELGIINSEVDLKEVLKLEFIQGYYTK